VTFGYTGMGVGQEWGVLLLRNQGPAPCALRESIGVTPVDAAGQPVPTKTLLASHSAVPPLVLAVSSGPASTSAVDSVPSVGVLVIGTYHYRSGSCPASYTTTPYSWRLTMAGEAATVRNDARGWRLSTCQGEFGVNDQVAGRALPIHPGPR
jgi:hypothetical protein